MFEGTMAELAGDDPTMTPPPPPRQKKERSSLLPDELDEFERAAQERSDIDLAPPYDTATAERPTRAKRGKRDNGERLDVDGGGEPSRQEQYVEALRKNDKMRLWVMRGHIKWAKKIARKKGFSEEEVSLWLLS